jgi:hypothetical protein
MSDAQRDVIDARARALWARTRLTVHPEPCMLVSLPRDASSGIIGLAAELAARGPFSALVIAADEISLTVPVPVWRNSALGAAARGESGPWAAIALDLEIDLDVTGYLAPAAARLAAAGIPIVPQCAYRKDYLLVRLSDRDRALAVLEALIASCRE